MFSLGFSLGTGSVSSSESWESSVSVGTSSLIGSEFWMVWGDFVERASLDEGVTISEPVVHWVEVWIDWSRWVLNLLSDGASLNKGVTVSEPVVHWVEVWINWSRWVLNLLSDGGSLNKGITVSKSVVHWIKVWIDWCRWVLNLSDLHMSTSRSWSAKSWIENINWD